MGIPERIISSSHLPRRAAVRTSTGRWTGTQPRPTRTSSQAALTRASILMFRPAATGENRTQRRRHSISGPERAAVGGNESDPCYPRGDTRGRQRASRSASGVATGRDVRADVARSRLRGRGTRRCCPRSQQRVVAQNAREHRGIPLLLRVAQRRVRVEVGHQRVDRPIGYRRQWTRRAGSRQYATSDASGTQQRLLIGQSNHVGGRLRSVGHRDRQVTRFSTGRACANGPTEPSASRSEPRESPTATATPSTPAATIARPVAHPRATTLRRGSEPAVPGWLCRATIDRPNTRTVRGAGRPRETREIDDQECVGWEPSVSRRPTSMDAGVHRTDHRRCPLARRWWIDLAPHS
jgi:hypothetical protein